MRSTHRTPVRYYHRLLRPDQRKITGRGALLCHSSALVYDRRGSMQRPRWPPNLVTCGTKACHMHSCLVPVCPDAHRGMRGFCVRHDIVENCDKVPLWPDFGCLARQRDDVQASACRAPIRMTLNFPENVRKQSVESILPGRNNPCPLHARPGGFQQARPRLIVSARPLRPTMPSEFPPLHT